MGGNVAKDKPKTLVRSWSAMVKRAWGSEYNRSDTAYEFSDGRKFDSSDRGDSGVYRKS